MWTAIDLYMQAVNGTESRLLGMLAVLSLTCARGVNWGKVKNVLTAPFVSVSTAQTSLTLTLWCPL